ncbi:hypothetical protein [Acidimangrovimonas sediminis]|uniref:hypothetical protein n=1 Tax=Acidimangrovimonas sediminis TaxID=2056283 RepID=UPI000C7FB5B4|nr:hypothetical protein [Acidimangrovimonas sediminis]
MKTYKREFFGLVLVFTIGLGTASIWLGDRAFEVFKLLLDPAFLGAAMAFGMDWMTKRSAP